MRTVQETREMINRSTLTVEEVGRGFAKLGEALAKAAPPLAAWDDLVIQLASDDQVKRLIEQLQCNISETLTRHYRDEAEPAEVVQYILQQPNNTWMGVTIYPDEAWRYACKSDWMWWRE